MNSAKDAYKRDGEELGLDSVAEFDKSWGHATDYVARVVKKVNGRPEVYARLEVKAIPGQRLAAGQEDVRSFTIDFPEALYQAMQK